MQALLNLSYLSTEQAVLAAWGEVEHLVNHIGEYSLILINDPLVFLTIEMLGGLSQVCSQAMLQMPTFSHQFMKTYRTLVEEKGGRHESSSTIF